MRQHRSALEQEGRDQAAQVIKLVRLGTTSYEEVLASLRIRMNKHSRTNHDAYWLAEKMYKHILRASKHKEMARIRRIKRENFG